MNQPDQQDGNDLRSQESDPGHDQDRRKYGVYRTKREHNLDLDLRDVVSAGKEFKEKHYSELRELPNLRLVLATARIGGYTKLDQEALDQPIAPGVVIAAIEAAINIVSDEHKSPHSKHYDKIRRILFGLTEDVKNEATGERWNLAHQHYLEYVAYFRHKSANVAIGTFRKMAYTHDLLPPIVTTLLCQEGDLRNRVNPWGVPLMGKEITHLWETGFWWLFNIEPPLSRAAQLLTLALHQGGRPSRLDNTDEDGLIMFSDEHVPFLELALVEIATLKQLAQLARPRAESNFRSIKLGMWIVEHIDETFSLTKRDGDWLHEYHGASASQNDSESIDEHSEHFILRLHTDSHGKLLLKRLQAIESACECSSGPSEGTSSCPFHEFIAGTAKLTELMKDDWFRLAKYCAWIGLNAVHDDDVDQS